MAIGHLNQKPVQRSKGHSAVHAAAYITRSRMYDERLGRFWDYSRKADEVLFSGVYVPKNAPAWMNDRAQLWNAAERADSKVNARPARSFDVALPHELTDEQNRMLLHDFVRENFARKGIAAEVTMHRPGKEGDDRNVHAHILITTRMVTLDGLGEKNRDLDRKETLVQWRDKWETHVNGQLCKHGHEQQISMKSLAEQGIDRTPEHHLGRNAMAQERKGQLTSRGDELQEVREKRVEQMIARQYHAIETGPAIGTDKGRSEDRERRAEELKQAERNLERSLRPTNMARDLLNAVRQLLGTLTMQRKRSKQPVQEAMQEPVQQERMRPGPEFLRQVTQQPAPVIPRQRRTPEPVKNPARDPAQEKAQTFSQKHDAEARKIKVVRQDEPERKIDGLHLFPRRGRRRVKGDPGFSD